MILFFMVMLFLSYVTINKFKELKVEYFKLFSDLIIRAAWPIVCVLIFFTIYKPLGQFLSKFHSFRFKHGESSVEMNSPENTTENSLAQSQSSGNEDDNKIPPPPTSCVSIWSTEIYALLCDNKKDEAEDVFKKYISTISDPDKQLTEKILYLNFKNILLNDLTVIDDLINISKHPINDDSVIQSLAVTLSDIYIHLRQYKKSAEIISWGIEKVSTPFIRTTLLRALANTLELNGESHKALDLLIENINKQEVSIEEKHILYLAIADIKKKMDAPFESVLNLDLSLEYDPLDKDTLFTAAYNASQLDLDSISIANYSSLIKIDESNSTAMNNLGVCAKDLDLDFIAIKFYKKSAEKGNTLAMTNLGYFYLNGGFISEAREIAQKALAGENPHENVHHLITDINKKEKELSEKWDRFVKSAYEKQAKLRKYTESHYEEKPFKVSDKWFINGKLDIPISVEQDNNLLVVKWKETKSSLGIGSNDYSMKLTGEIINSSFSGIYEEKIDNLSNTSFLNGKSNSTFPVYGYRENNIISLFKKDLQSEWELKLIEHAPDSV